MMRNFRALNEAIAQGDNAKAKEIIASGKDVSYLDWQALRKAAKHGRVEIVAILADMADDDGRINALLEAIVHKKIEVVELLAPSLHWNDELKEAAFELVLVQPKWDIVHYLWDKRSKMHTDDVVFKKCISKLHINDIDKIFAHLLSDTHQVSEALIAMGLKEALNQDNPKVAILMIDQCIKRNVSMYSQFYYTTPSKEMTDALFAHLDDHTLKHIAKSIPHMKGTHFETQWKALQTKNILTEQVSSDQAISPKHKKM